MPARPRLVTGLAVGRAAVAALTIEHRPAGPLVRGVGRAALTDPVASVRRAAAAVALRAARLQSGHTGLLVTAVPAGSAVIREARFPALTDQALVGAIHAEARKHIPLELRDAAFDFRVVARNDATHDMLVLLAALPRRHLAELIEELGPAAEPWIVDAEPLAAMNALLALDPLGMHEAHALLEVNGTTGSFTLASADGHFLTRPVGGAGQADEEASVEKLFQDVLRTLSYFRELRGDRTALRLAVAGSGGLRERLVDRIQTAFGLRCTIPTLFDRAQLGRRVEPPADFEDGASTELLVAFGLALRAAGAGGASPLFAVNLYPERATRARRGRRRVLRLAVATAVLAANVLALGFLGIALYSTAEAARRDATEAAQLKAWTGSLATDVGRARAWAVLDAARREREQWAPGLMTLASLLPPELVLESVALGKSAGENGSRAPEMKIRGVVLEGGADPYASVRIYVERLRSDTDLARRFPIIRPAATWEARGGDGRAVRRFEILCVTRESS